LAGILDVSLDELAGSKEIRDIQQGADHVTF